MESWRVSKHYVVIGNPVAHSKSPLIHTAFAQQTGQDVCYERLLAPLDGFVNAVRNFQAEGGNGANVTVPFKEAAWQLADTMTPRARLAGAANTLVFTDLGIHADNTDGVGLVTDIQKNLGYALAGRRVLVMGAGGAARGVIAPILAALPAFVVIANRTMAKAEALRTLFTPFGIVEAANYQALAGMQFDCVINATSASLAGQVIDLPDALFATGSLVYDMMYAVQPTPFMQYAQQHGAAQVADGLGMLVEQAAVAFYLWQGVMPDTHTVISHLRAL
jgi:shikimate dehydrogenase